MGKVHAGHQAQGKFRVYGEGGVWHPKERPCDCWGRPNKTLPLHHPVIIRTDYNSRWHFYRVELANWLFERQLRRTPHPVDDEKTLRMPPLRGWLRWVGIPFPRLPEVRAPISNEQSIYEYKRTDVRDES